MKLLTQGRIAASCAACVLALLAAAPHDAFADDSIEFKRAELDRKHEELLNKKADALAARGNADAAKALRQWHVNRRPGRKYLFLPAEGDVPRPANFPDDAELRKLQTFYAHYLFNLAKQALADDRPALAYQLVHETLRADPQHALARSILDVDKGKPFVERELGAGWEIETDHFEVTTNDSREAGVAVGRRLEELHAVWRQLFAEYWFTRAELARRFDGKPSSVAEPNHKVMLFANKQQYIAHLERDEPGIAVSLGYYAEKPRTAYFFDGDDNTLATQFHEATHQLFHERQRRGRAAGLDDNFWVVEGVATYMESLHKGDGYYTVGGPGAYRLQFARYRALTEEYYVPLSELVALGRADMKAKGDDLPRLYSQAAGLSHFFMDAGGGKYRDAFVQYLDAVYRDKADAATLARLTGKRYEELDREYLEFLRASDDDLAGLIPGEHVPRLYLGHTRITDAAVDSIASVDGLERLDIGHRPITDAGLKKLSASETLIQLNLEQTNITDASLPHIAEFTQLRELDLSGCRITDAGLAEIAKLKNLEVLWLTGTPVSDAGLSHLHGLKNLTFVDVNGSKVTAGGWAELKRVTPGLNEDR